MTPSLKTKRIWILVQKDCEYDRLGNERTLHTTTLATSCSSSVATAALAPFVRDEKEGGGYLRTVVKFPTVEALPEEQESSAERVLRLVKVGPGR